MAPNRGLGDGFINAVKGSIEQPWPLLRRLPEQLMSEGETDDGLKRGLVELPASGERIGRLRDVRNGI